MGKYGAARLAGIFLAALLLAYELGTPGHTRLEGAALVLYVISLAEAATFAWTRGEWR